MKRLIFIMVMLITFTSQAQFNWFEWNQDEEFLLNVWVDPTFTDKGEQYGIGVTKELGGGWVSAEISYYGALEPYYLDLVGSGGANFHLFRNDAVKYYVGGRLGWIHRGDGYSPHALMGVTGGFDIKINDIIRGFPDVRLGLRYWGDFRTDQHEDFLGGTDDNQWRDNVGGVVTFPLN